MLLNLKTEMQKMRVTNNDIAEKLGVSRGTVENKIKGESPLTFEEALKIKDVFFPYADMQWLFKKTNIA